MIDETEAEYFALRAAQCRAVGRAATDPALQYAHRALAERYDEWALASAAKERTEQGQGGE
ncbi:hypothetical protein SAMN06297144_0252 [Sphingomonas guangdongensis]|uniref:Uncharacterized protein n=1 Tax=Sphingomonas guangdongensis TaxID=1141890 RepID=A0A285QBK7_9SPHN|nr:hypothetical protein [Sphingomonas guangdongensis]SOB78864.1 hypothetical protein SAMN06297144_0252 [Sphingomonas guangdongensis]